MSATFFTHDSFTSKQPATGGRRVRRKDVSRIIVALSAFRSRIRPVTGVLPGFLVSATRLLCNSSPV